jgi:hypothetical protein
MKRTRIGNWIVLGFITVGVVISGYIMFLGAQEAKIPAVRHPHLPHSNTTNPTLAMSDYGRQLRVDQ